MLLIIAMILIGYKGLFLTTFDPAFAASIGVSSLVWHYVLMSAVSVTTVVSFESVGAIISSCPINCPCSNRLSSYRRTTQNATYLCFSWSYLFICWLLFSCLARCFCSCRNCYRTGYRVHPCVSFCSKKME